MCTTETQTNNQLPVLPSICIHSLSSSTSVDHLDSMDSNAATMLLTDTPPLQKQQLSSKMKMAQLSAGIARCDSHPPTHTLYAHTRGICSSLCMAVKTILFKHRVTSGSVWTQGLITVGELAMKTGKDAYRATQCCMNSGYIMLPSCLGRCWKLQWFLANIQ